MAFHFNTKNSLNKKTSFNNDAGTDSQQNSDQGSVIKSYSILALFSNHHKAAKAIKNLKNSGYNVKDIYLLKSKKNGEKDFAYHLGTYLKSGAVIGGIIGFFALGITGFIIGLQDPMMLGASSLFKYTLAGLLMGVVFGTASGALVGIGAPKSTIKRYSFYIKEGGTVLMLHLKNKNESLKSSEILELAGGQDIHLLEESQIWSQLIPDMQQKSNLKSSASSSEEKPPINEVFIN